jgi:phosphoglycerate dehydrogenase-like enzyme
MSGGRYDAINLDAAPSSLLTCNCFGHETAIAESVIAALLQHSCRWRDERRRQGDRPCWAGSPQRAHPEFAGSTLGLLGFRDIGEAVPRRTNAFDIHVRVANRSPVVPSELVDPYYPLSDL